MTTTRELITDAAAACGGIDPQESLEAGLAQLMLRRFNDLVASWSNESLFIFDVYLNELPLVANQASYSTALLADGRPISIDNGFVRMSSVDYPLQVIGQELYNDITYKPSPGIPSKVYLDSKWPDSFLYFFDVPYGTMTAHLYLRRLLQAEATLDTDISLPPGYKKALIDGLAVDIAGPVFGLEVKASLDRSATAAKAVLKRTNRPLQRMYTDVPARYGRQFNIYSGNNE